MVMAHPELHDDIRKYSLNTDHDNDPVFETSVQLLKDELWDAAMFMRRNGARFLVDEEEEYREDNEFIFYGDGFKEDFEDFKRLRPVLTGLISLHGWDIVPATDFHPDEEERDGAYFITNEIIQLLYAMMDNPHLPN